MFDNATYFFYTLIFTVPLILILWGYFIKILRQGSRFIVVTTLLLTMYGFYLWPLGLEWKTWAYNSEKLLGITILGTVLEDTLWWVLVAFLLSSFTIIMVDKEDKKESLLKRE